MADDTIAPIHEINGSHGMLVDADIERFVRDDYPRLVNAVALVTRDVYVAEELVQEATARAWDESSRGRDITSLPNWVAAVSLNLARSRWRRLAAERRARTAYVEDRPSTASDDRLAVEAALAALPRRQREVAVLRYLIGMSTAETATVLRVGEGTVKNSLSKARVALAASLRIEDVNDADR
jgi:RNA polymerase sigma-70 factor (ECF subfamily)